MQYGNRRSAITFLNYQGELMHTISLKFKLALALVVAFAAPGFVSAQAIPASCTAMVQVNSDLWLVRPDGRPTAQLTRDGRTKFAVAMSPNGKVIAFSGRDYLADVTLIDAGGRQLGSVDVPARDLITGLEWVSGNQLKVQEHLNPRNSLYSFLTIATDPFTSVSQLPAAKVGGGNCALARDGKNMACMAGDSVTLNERDVYYLAGPFESATVLQSVDAAVGTTVAATTRPSLRIEVKEIVDQTVHLKATTSDGQGQEQYVPNGGSMRLAYAPPADLKGAPPIYAVTASINKYNPGVVSLIVKQSKMALSFEAGPVWDPRGKRIAFIESDTAGQRWLVLINKEMGAAAQLGGALDARVLLPVAGPVASIRFASDTHIVVEGASQVFEQDIPAQGKVPANASYTIKPALPKQLNVTIGPTSTLTAVNGWTF